MDTFKEILGSIGIVLFYIAIFSIATILLLASLVKEWLIIETLVDHLGVL